ncbi:MAG: helical backbone metal receptor [Planctomycetota bacterium]|nr:helical backbone metal receptor [Planctomycetota bacterium]
MRHVALVLLLFVASCGGDEPAALPACMLRAGEEVNGDFATFEKGDEGRGYVTYNDGLVLGVPRRPLRIVSTAPGITETVAHLDGLKHLVGVTPYCNHPEGVEDIAQVTVMPINVEAILALEPDLVIADRTLHRSSVDALRRRFEGRLLLLETSRSLAHYKRSVAMLTMVLHDDPVALTTSSNRPIDRGRRLVGKIGLVRELIAGRLRRETYADPHKPLPRVLIVSQWEPLYVEGPDTLMGDLVRMCGCVNVACDLDHPSNTFNEELVLVRKPDVILHREASVPERLRKRWASVPAFQQGRVASVAGDAFSRGGPRLVDALRVLHDALAGERPMSALGDVK